MQIFDPIASEHVAPTVVRRPLNSLEGKVVGFIDNAKPNFNHLVEDLAELMINQYGVSRVIARRKRSAGMAAPDAMLRELTKQCDAVITGSGD